MGKPDYRPEYKVDPEKRRLLAIALAKRYGLNPQWLMAIPQQESSGYALPIHADGTGKGLTGLDTKKGKWQDYLKYTGGKGQIGLEEINFLAKDLAAMKKRFIARGMDPNQAEELAAGAWHTGPTGALQNPEKASEYVKLLKRHFVPEETLQETPSQTPTPVANEAPGANADVSASAEKPEPRYFAWADRAGDLDRQVAKKFNGG